MGVNKPAVPAAAVCGWLEPSRVQATTALPKGFGEAGGDGGCGAFTTGRARPSRQPEQRSNILHSLEKANSGRARHDASATHKTVKNPELRKCD